MQSRRNQWFSTCSLQNKEGKRQEEMLIWETAMPSPPLIWEFIPPVQYVCLYFYWNFCLSKDFYSKEASEKLHWPASTTVIRGETILSRAAFTKYLKLDGLTQQKFVVSRSERPKDQCWEDRAPSKGPRGGSFLAPSSGLQQLLMLLTLWQFCWFSKAFTASWGTRSPPEPGAQPTGSSKLLWSLLFDLKN